MTAPVLVRRRLTKVDRVQFAKDSNISDLQEMAASEKAFVDADSITPAMMRCLTHQKAEICLAAVMTRLFADS
ncbi:Uncharacterised protein [Escherichia coli]|nr:Uncharacterised protein [Escherichia coli]